MVAYFGWLRHFDAGRVTLILICSLIGIAGSYGVAWFGMRINTLANSRSAFASLQGQSFPCLQYPFAGGDEHRDASYQHRAFCHVVHPSFYQP